jgi:hypothetical protein
VGTVTTAIESKRQAAPRADAWWFTLIAIAFVALQLPTMGAWSMVTRPLWLDEIHTYLVVGQPLSEGMRSLAAGADFNPPAVFFLYRLAVLVTGDLTAVTARLVAWGCVIAALSGVYLLLRDQFSRWAAAVGAMSVWAQQVVMHAAFEARFYGPLLLSATWFLLALRRTARCVPTLASAAWLSVASIALCTTHYFGVLSWGIGVGAALVFTASPHRGTLVRRLLPAIAGPVALAACIPFYFGQRASLTVPTWMSDVSVGAATKLLAVFLLTLPVAIALACWVLTQVLEWRKGVRRAAPSGQGLALGPALLLAQVAVPFVLVLFSLLILPATELRYWIVGAVVTAPLVALVMQRGDTLVRWIATLGIIGASVKTMRGEAGRADGFAQRVQQDVRLATQLTDSGSVVVARWRDTLYPLLVARPSLRSRVSVLDSTPLDGANAFLIVERDVSRTHQRLYGWPKIITPAELAQLPSFYLMEPENESAPTSKEFPRRAITRVADRVFRLAWPASPPGGSEIETR